MHRDHVPTVPESFHLLGSTPISYNQGMIRYLPTTGAVPTRRPLTDIQILTTQGHPEFTDFISTTLIRYRASTPGTSLDEETAKAGLVTARGSHDGVKVVGRVIWGILGVTDF
jgi:GMP synthase-like glutamine amidotransferase